MSISAGDAILTFIGDTENLDQAFQQLPAKSQAAFTAAAKYTQTFNEELDATGENVKFAGERILSLTDAFRTLSIQGPERLKQKLDDARNAFDTLKSAGVNATGTLLQATAKVIEKEIAYTTAIGQSTLALREQLALTQSELANLGGVAVPAGRELEQAGKLGAEAFHEARGTMALAGEEIGIRLPRELRGFIAQLPGVGAAMSAAFEAVAVIALIGFIVELTNKLTELVSETFIFTEQMKKSNEIIAEHNKTLLATAANLKSAKDAYSLLGLEGVRKTAEQLRQFNIELGKNSTQLAEAKSKLDSLTASTTEFQKQNAAQIAEAQEHYIELAKQAQVFEVQRSALQKQAAIERRTAELQAGAVILAAHKSATEAFIEYDAQARRLLLANQGTLANQETLIEYQKNQRLYEAQVSFLKAKRDALDQDVNATKAQKQAADSAILDLETKHAADMLKVEADLIKEISALPLRELLPAWQFTSEQLKSDTLNMADALNDLASSAERSARRSNNALKTFADELARTGSKSKAYGAVMTSLFDDLALATSSGFTAAILGQKSLGDALAEGTKAEAAAIAGRAAAWAIYYTAHAIADTFWNPGKAAAEFTSAGIFASLAAVAAGISLAIPGGGSENSPEAPSNLPPTPATSGSSGGQQSPNVPRLALGGLVSRPTMAIIGDSLRAGGSTRKGEGILPLDDDRAMNAIAGEIANRINLNSGAAGATVINHHWQIEGMVSADNLSKIVKRINRQVEQGQAKLTSSNSFRVTRRG